MIETLLQKALTEYGLLIAVFIVITGLLWRKLAEREARVDALTDKSIAALNANTQVLTEMKIRLEQHSV